MGIHIDAPKIVQTRNTLNAVPSGSTAEADNNVKYVPQTLTDAQKAQARQNIGAAAAGETGGATVNEFHYKRGGEEGSYYYYIDCQGYTPAEGDLMVVVFDWPMYPEHNPITLMNGSDNPSFVLLNAPASEYNYYDDIEGTVNTRWMVKLEKVNNVWTAYNVNTVELADWNVTDPNAIGYIKNKPEISDDFNADNCLTFYWNNMSQGTVANILRIDAAVAGVKYLYENGVKAVYNSTATKNDDLAVGEWGHWSGAVNYKFRAPIKNLNVIKIGLNNGYYINMTNTTANKCIGMIIPNNPIGSYTFENNTHCYDNVSTSYLNYTIIIPKWIANNSNGNAPDTTKQVMLNTNPTDVKAVGSAVTELVLSNTAVPASVYTAVQSSTITKVWLPRATYELAVVDTNWSTYASKLFPYDDIVFGPYNDVQPIVMPKEADAPFPFFGNSNMLIIKSDRQTGFTTASGKFLDIWRNGVYEHLGSASDNIRSVSISKGINYIKCANLYGEQFEKKQGNYVLYTPCVNTPLTGTYTGSMKIVPTSLSNDYVYHQGENDGTIHFLTRNIAQMARIGSNTFTYVFTDNDFTYVNAWPATMPSTVLATFYVPRNRYNEFVNLVNTQYPNDDTFPILKKVIVYDFIEWLDFEPYIRTNVTTNDFNANDCFTFYWQGMSQDTAYNVLRLNENPNYIDYMYDNGIRAVLNTSVSDPADLAVGEWMPYGSAMYYKFRPAINGINTLKIRFKGTPIIWVSTYDIDNGCVGMLLPEEGTYLSSTFGHGYWAYNVGSSYINNTIICPKWFDNVNASDGLADVTKQVVLNTNPYNVDQVGVNVTDIILTNTSVPASVYTGVQSNTVTSVWLPRTTYNMAILDANWSAYASKLKPYDFLSFGPYNYVVPVAFNSVALTMTDANGTVISGDFVAQNVTVTPAV